MTDAKQRLLDYRVRALSEASTVLDWTIAVRMAKWGQLNLEEQERDKDTDQREQDFIEQMSRKDETEAIREHEDPQRGGAALMNSRPRHFCSF